MKNEHGIKYLGCKNLAIVGNWDILEDLWYLNVPEFGGS